MTKIIRVPKANENYKFLRWVCLATSYDPTIRKVLTRILFEKKDEILYAIATCGHSLHRAIIREFDDYEPGLYEILKNDGNEIVLLSETDETLKYPDYRKVILDKEDYKMFELDTDSKYRTNNNYATCLRNMSTDGVLDLSLFKKAESILKEIGTATVKINLKTFHSPIMIESSKILALVMPIRKLA